MLNVISRYLLIFVKIETKLPVISDIIEMEYSIITDRDVVLSGSNFYMYGDGFTVCNMFFLL